MTQSFSLSGFKRILCFSAIKRRTCRLYISENNDNGFINSIKTIKGNTQNSERYSIDFFKRVLESLSLDYNIAGSQQSKDFRNVGNIGLDIEIKKTDNLTIFFNDTLPTENIYYIIFFTGKIFKNETKNIDPCILFINGYDFIKDSPWVNEYYKEINELKNKWCRGENKKKLSGPMEVYTRPTFKANIKHFINNSNYT